MPLVIRPATRVDIPALGRLGAALVRAHHEFDAKRFIAASAETEEGYGRFLGTQLGKADVVVLVAEEGGEVVGFAYAGLEGPDYMSLRGAAGALYDIVVDPRCRGGGIGRQLLDAALAFLKAHGAPRVVLSRAVQNEPARRLFERAGFRPTMVEMTAELDG